MLLLILVLLFTLLPLAEIFLLVRIEEAIDLPATIGLVLATGIIGAALARWQGTLALGRIHAELQAGGLPTRALFDGALILFAGAVLITPGVITDIVGFLLLVPFVRTQVARALRWWAGSRFQVMTHTPGAPVPPGGEIIDAEVIHSGPSDEQSPPPIPNLELGEP